MKRRGWLIFVVVQTVGVVCAWTAGHFLSALGPNLWVTGFVLLLPGNLVGAFILEKLLWMSGVTTFQLNLLCVPVELAINAGVWLACARLYRVFRGRQIK